MRYAFAMLMLTVLSFATLGDGLRDALGLANKDTDL